MYVFIDWPAFWLYKAFCGNFYRLGAVSGEWGLCARSETAGLDPDRLLLLVRRGLVSSNVPGRLLLLDVAAGAVRSVQRRP